MKRFLTFTLILVSVLLSLKTAAASKRASVGILTQTLPMINDEEKTDDEDPVRHRIPTVPTYLTIDFENAAVYGIASDTVSVFEVWNKDGETLLAAFCRDEDFVKYLDSLEGEFQLRLHTSEYVYVGYISL